MAASSADTIIACNVGFDRVNLHRPTTALESGSITAPDGTPDTNVAAGVIITGGAGGSAAAASPAASPSARGLHSSTFRLNVSAFCGIEVHLGVAYGVLRRCSGVSGGV